MDEVLSLALVSKVVPMPEGARELESVSTEPPVGPIDPLAH
jgi:hypothetical protein